MGLGEVARIYRRIERVSIPSSAVWVGFKFAFASSVQIAWPLLCNHGNYQVNKIIQLKETCWSWFCRATWVPTTCRGNMRWRCGARNNRIERLLRLKTLSRVGSPLIEGMGISSTLDTRIGRRMTITLQQVSFSCIILPCNPYLKGCHEISRWCRKAQS